MHFLLATQHWTWIDISATSIKHSLVSVDVDVDMSVRIFVEAKYLGNQER